MKKTSAFILLLSVVVVFRSLAGTETNSPRGFRGPTEMEAFVDGVPSLMQKALWLPLLAIPLLVATVWFCVRAWPRKYWGLVGRIHYSLVAMAGLALLGWLYYWNLLGFHYG